MGLYIRGYTYIERERGRDVQQSNYLKVRDHVLIEQQRVQGRRDSFCSIGDREERHLGKLQITATLSYHMTDKMIVYYEAFRLTSMVRLTVSPGITISVPSGSLTDPVTSAVRTKNCGLSKPVHGEGGGLKGGNGGVET